MPFPSGSSKDLGIGVNAIYNLRCVHSFLGESVRVGLLEFLRQAISSEESRSSVELLGQGINGPPHELHLTQRHLARQSHADAVRKRLKFLPQGRIAEHLRPTV